MNSRGLILLMIVMGACWNIATAQDKLLKKSWIKASIDEFNKKTEGPDTIYIRFIFNNSTVLYGFEPSVHYTTMPFLRAGNLLTIGYDQWTMETLTDSTLTIVLPGFRRMKFYAEDYLQTKDEYLVQIGEYKGKPLYKANRVITPRYKKPNPLIDDIKKYDRTDDYNIRKAGIFQMSFIVTDEGKIEEPKIIKGVKPGFDDSIVEELRKTSKRWMPAMFKGQPVQTLVIFEIKFLDSLNQY